MNYKRNTWKMEQMENETNIKWNMKCRYIKQETLMNDTVRKQNKQKWNCWKTEHMENGIH